MTLLDGVVRDQPSLRSLLAILSEGVLATDLNGVRLWSNAALDRLVGHDACEPRRSSAPPSFLPGDNREAYLSCVEKARRGALTNDYIVLEFPIITADGETIEVPVHVIPVLNGGNTPAGMLWVFLTTTHEDLARMRRLEGALDRIAGELDALGYTSKPCNEQNLPGLDHLSPREAEVFDLLLVGHRVSTMADILCLSTHTIRNHLKSIFRKTGVHSQAELIRLARGEFEPSGNGNGDRAGNGNGNGSKR